MNLDREELERVTAKNSPEGMVDGSPREAWLALGQLLENTRPASNNDALLARLQKEIQSDRLKITRPSPFRRWWWVVPCLATAASLAIFLWNKELPQIAEPTAPVITASQPLEWDQELRKQVVDVDQQVNQTVAFGSTTREFAAVESDLQALAASLSNDTF